MLQGNFEAAFFSWVNESDPDPFSLFHSSQVAPTGLNVGRYVSTDADRLSEPARVEFDPTLRAALYHQRHGPLARDQPLFVDGASLVEVGRGPPRSECPRVARCRPLPPLSGSVRLARRVVQ